MIIEPITRLHKPDLRSGDNLVAIVRWCNHEWSKIFSQLPQGVVSKAFEIGKRIVYAVVLTFITLLAYPIGAVGLVRKSLSKNDLQELVTKSKDAEKQVALNTLHYAYSAAQVNPLVSTDLRIEILSNYAAKIYPEFEKCLDFCKAALHFQLQQLKLIPNTLELSNFKKIEMFNLGEPTIFDAATGFLTHLKSAQYLETFKELSNEKKFQLAKILLTMGACYNNLSKNYFKLEKEAFNTFLDNLYGGIRELLLHLPQSEDVKKELAELQYNVIPWRHLGKSVGDGKATKEQLFEAFKIFDETLQYQNTLPLKARMANLKGCRYYDHFPAELPQVKEYFRESLNTWKEVLKDTSAYTPAQIETYKMLFANVNGSYISMLIKMGGASIQELEEHTQWCLHFVKNHRDNPYVMIHLLNLASVAKHKRDKAKAWEYLNEMKLISKKWQSWPQTKDLLANEKKKEEELNALPG